MSHYSNDSTMIKLDHSSEYGKDCLRFFYNGSIIAEIICFQWIPKIQEQIIFVNDKYFVTEVIHDYINKTCSCYLSK